jgi:DNA-damage-inducible protein J
MSTALTAVIHARIDPSTKETTERILNSIGLSPAEALRLFYRQIAIRGEFPLELRVPNQTTVDALSRAECGEDVEHFSNLESLYGSWGS